VGRKKAYLFVTPYFPSPDNWRGTYCYDMAQAIRRDGRYEVVVFKPGNGEDYDYRGVRVHVFREKVLPSAIFPFLFVRYNQRSFLAAVRRAGIGWADVAVCHAHTAALALYPLAVKKANPHCLTLLHHHDLQSFGLNNGLLRHCWFYNLIEFPILRWYHERMDCHVFLSEMAKMSFSRAPDTSWTSYAAYTRQMRGLPYRPVRLKRSVVYNNGVDTAIFNREAKEKGEGEQRKDKTFTIGCVGNFEVLKDQETLIRAVERIAEVKSEGGQCRIHVFFVGSGPTLEPCKLLARSIEDKDNLRCSPSPLAFTFLSEVPHAQLADFYRTLDLFVLPSYFEGFGCVYTEAWSCGTPFITTTGAGVVELIPPEDRPRWVVAPRDPQALATKIAAYYEQRPPQRLIAPVDIDTLTRKFVDEIDRARESL